VSEKVLQLQEWLNWLLKSSADVCDVESISIVVINTFLFT
jgi:hypothetical protein